MKRLGELNSNMTVVFQKNRFLAKKIDFLSKIWAKKSKILKVPLDLSSRISNEASRRADFKYDRCFSKKSFFGQKKSIFCQKFRQKNQKF